MSPKTEIVIEQTPPAQPKRRLRKWLLRISAALLIYIIFGFVVGRRLNVHTEQIALGLPAPVKLVVLADFHVIDARTAASAGQALAEAMRQQPDAILLPGDFVSTIKGIGYLPGLFKDVHAPLGVYAVRGNHDHWTAAEQVQAALESAGVKLLVDRNVLLHKGKTTLALAGIEDLWYLNGQIDWTSAYKDIPPGMPIVLMSHNPDAALMTEGQRAQLIVSGHTHAGHVWMPNILRHTMGRMTGMVLPPMTAYGMAHLYGLMQERWGWIYITSGTNPGYLSPLWRTRPEVGIPRWYTRTEVVVLELR